MRYSTDKDCHALIVGLVSSGWTYLPKGRHGKLRAPGGGMLVFSRTPSDWRTVRNLRRDLRYLVREHS